MGRESRTLPNQNVCVALQVLHIRSGSRVLCEARLHTTSATACNNRNRRNHACLGAPPRKPWSVHAWVLTKAARAATPRSTDAFAPVPTVRHCTHEAPCPWRAHTAERLHHQRLTRHIHHLICVLWPLPRHRHRWSSLTPRSRPAAQSACPSRLPSNQDFSYHISSATVH